jgi:hypothetical protein
MSQRDWCSNFATAGWVAFFVLLGILWAEGVAIFPKTEIEPDYCNAATNKKNTDDVAPARPPTKDETPPSEPKARSGRHSEKCVQWRSAVAAETQASYTRFGFWLLALTLCFTAWAAISARNAATSTRASADGAGRSADVARETLIATQRAWLERIEIVPLDDLRRFPGGPMGVSIGFAFKNIGNAPALHVRTLAWLLPGIDGRIPWREAEKRFNEVKSKALDGGLVIYPGRTYDHRRDPNSGMPHVAISADQIERACDKGPEAHLLLYVAVCIDYTFPSDARNHHQANFLMSLRRVDGFPISANVTTANHDLQLSDAYADYYPAD